MKKLLTIVLGLGLAISISTSVMAADIVVADFNSASEDTTNLGTKFGAWDKDPADTTQSCSTSLSAKTKVGKSGNSLKIKYDVDSPNPAYNGIWIQLNNLDASKASKLTFKAKGAKAGCTTKVKLELKKAGESANFVVDGITTTWSKIEVPLSSFGLSDVSALTELVFVFDDVNSTVKEGTLYLDDLTFE